MSMSNSPLRYPGVNPRVKVYIDAQVQASPRDISRSSPAPERSTTNILLACLACYLLTCGIFAASPRLQSQLVYLHYARWPLGDLTNLARFGIAEGRSVTISLAGNETIRGYHLMPVGPASIEGASLKDQRRDDFFDAQIRGAANIVVYLHGNAATRAHPRRIDMIKQIAAFCNAHVLAFDYRGFGDSIGTPSEDGTVEDVAAIMAYIASLKVHEGVKVFLYGESLGTGIAVAYLSQHPEAAHPSGSVRGLILLAPFTSLPAAALSHPIAAPFRLFPIVKEFMLKNLFYQYPSISTITSINIPLLLLHGTDDSHIPASQGNDLFSAYLSNKMSAAEDASCSVEVSESSQECSSSKGLKKSLSISKHVEIPGGCHTDLLYTKEWLLEVPSFINHPDI